MEIKRQHVEIEVKESLSNATGLDTEAITSEKNIKNDLSLDSLEFIEVIMDMEQRLNIMVPDDDLLSNDMTVGKFMDYIYNKANE